MMSNRGDHTEGRVDIFAGPTRRRGKRPMAVRGTQPPVRRAAPPTGAVIPPPVPPTPSEAPAPPAPPAPRTGPIPSLPPAPPQTSSLVPAPTPVAPAVTQPLAPAAGEDDEQSRETEPKKKKRRRIRRNPRTDRGAERGAGKAEKVAFAESLGGARLLQRAVQWALFIAVAVILAVGVRQIFWPTDTLTESDVEAVVDSKLTGQADYPTAAAEGFAVAFAGTYYTWSPETAEAREVELTKYLAASVDDGWSGEGTQSLVAGPIVVAETTVQNDTTGIVHLAAQTDKGIWLYFGVVVIADSPTQLVVAAPPAIEPPPAEADYTGYVFGEEDRAVSTALAADMPGFLNAWSASSPAELQRYLAPDATAAASTGLQGSVSLVEVVDVVAAASGGDARQAQVTVVWATGPADDPTASTITQTYLLEIRQIDGKWYVRDITAGQPDSSEADAPTTQSEPTDTQPTPTPSAPSPGE